ncbi:MAG: dockerin type I domain-containing protein [Erysipelotrichaceae bacterium]|nr:dockerin type I domain-containing protein [Erysipelotrichaceae bacterium]
MKKYITAVLCGLLAVSNTNLIHAEETFTAPADQSGWETIGLEPAWQGIPETASVLNTQEASYDINYDDVTDEYDILSILEFAAKFNSLSEIPEIDEEAADLNEDGEINALDAYLLSALLDKNPVSYIAEGEAGTNVPVSIYGTEVGGYDLDTIVSGVFALEYYPDVTAYSATVTYADYTYVFVDEELSTVFVAFADPEGFAPNQSITDVKFVNPAVKTEINISTIENNGDIYIGEDPRVVEIGGQTAIDLKAVNLTLTGNIGVNFTFDIPAEERADTYISFTLNGNTERFSAENAEADENGLLRFTALAAAKEMRDPITVRVENEAGDLKQFESNGAAFDGTFTYTVENYFKSVRKNYSNLTELLNLVNAMDTYGKYAQINFSYNTEGMEAPDALGTVALADLEQFKSTGTGSVTGITVSNISLSLESDTGVKAYFTVDAGHSIDEYVIKADNADVELVETGSANTYYAQLKGAAAKDLDEAIHITITNHDETETQSITYYPLSYVRSIIKNSVSYETELVDVCKALYFYWVNAEEYFSN